MRTSGTNPQIRNLGLILALLVLPGCRTPKTWTAAPPPSLGTGQDDSKPYNVVWSKTNSNGSLNDPAWGSQKLENKLPPAECRQEPYQCTGQNPAEDDPKGLNNFFCSVVAPDKNFYGHSDWAVAEYRGPIGWLNFAVDGDYDWVLKPGKLQGGDDANLAGLTDNNFPQGGAPPKPEFIELEFDSRETAPHFGDEPDAKWWPELSKKAFDSLIEGNFDRVDDHLHPNKTTLACGVVTGLFGLDCDHGCRSEVHPVYTLALQMDEDPHNNQWLVLVRNWGNGGFCSGFNDELTASQTSVLLPVTSSARAPQKVSVEQFAGTAGVDCPTYGYDSNAGGEKLLFDLPAPQQQGMAVMMVTLRWPDGAQTMQCSAVDVNELRNLRGDVVSGKKEIDAEGRLAKIMRDAGMNFSSAQNPVFTRDITQRYLDSHPPKAEIMTQLRGGATITKKMCPAPIESAMEKKLTQKTPPHPQTKLTVDKGAAARNQALFAEVCQQYAKQNKPLPVELQRVCSGKSVQAK
jgi:hypothetical protein